MKKSVSIIVMLTFFVGMFWLYSTNASQSVESANVAKPEIRPIPTAEVLQVGQSGQRIFPGVVQAGSRVELAFPIDGVLVELNGQEGRKVKKGEILARLDERDAKNGYDAARANYKRAKSEYDRSKTLHKKGVVPEAEFDAASTSLSVSHAEMKIRKKVLEDAIIKAPFDGIIAQRYVENFSFIKGKDPILAFKDIARIDVVIQIPETLIANGATKSKNIQVKFDAEGRVWHEAEIREYRVQSDQATRAFEVTVSLNPPKGIDILPGMTASVRVDTSGRESHEDVNMVPVEAVFGGSDGSSYAWVIPADGGNPKKVKVTLGAITDAGVQIKSGLESGQQVAIAGVHSLRADLLVRPFAHNRKGLDG